MNANLLMLLRRRDRYQRDGIRRDDIGLLDTLTNVVGVLALISALMSIFAAAGSLNIQAPMARRSQQGFHLLQASGTGIWDLQPAVERMVQADRDRVAAVRRCSTLRVQEQQRCNAALDDWSRQQQVGPINVTVNHSRGTIQRQGPPTVSTADLARGSRWLDTTMERLSRDNQAVFVMLENDGFNTYRTIKAKAQQYGVRLGWEPWFTNKAIHFWSDGGRRLTVQ